MFGASQQKTHGGDWSDYEFSEFSQIPLSEHDLQDQEQFATTIEGQAVAVQEMSQKKDKRRLNNCLHSEESMQLLKHLVADWSDGSKTSPEALSHYRQALAGRGFDLGDEKAIQRKIYSIRTMDSKRLKNSTSNTQQEESRSSAIKRHRHSEESVQLLKQLVADWLDVSKTSPEALSHYRQALAGRGFDLGKEEELLLRIYAIRTMDSKRLKNSTSNTQQEDSRSSTIKRHPHSEESVQLLSQLVEGWANGPKTSPEALSHYRQALAGRGFDLGDEKAIQRKIYAIRTMDSKRLKNSTSNTQQEESRSGTIKRHPHSEESVQLLSQLVADWSDGSKVSDEALSHYRQVLAGAGFDLGKEEDIRRRIHSIRTMNSKKKKTTQIKDGKRTE